MRVGDMALQALHCECAAEGSATPVFNYITTICCAGGLTDQTPVGQAIALRQPFDHFYCAIRCHTFFVAGNQKCDATIVVGLLSNKPFCRNDHRRQRALHIGCAAAK